MPLSPKNEHVKLQEPAGGLAAPATVFLGYGGHSSGRAELLGSFNGGRSWASAYRGDFFYLGFTSSSQGVGLLRRAPNDLATSEMVITFDGGRHWAKVRF